MPDRSRYAHITDFVVRNSGELKPRELRVLLCLLLHLNRRTGRCDPSRRTIGEYLGLEPPHVSVAIAGLVSKGCIKETADGFLFAAEVTNLVTETDAEKLPIWKQKVTNLARKVTNLVNRHNIDQQRKQRIEQLSIDEISARYDKRFPGKDRRIIEVGVLYTMAQRNGSKDRIGSLAYFTPEIEKREREITEGKGDVKLKDLDKFLEYMRQSYERRSQRNA